MAGPRETGPPPVAGGTGAGEPDPRSASLFMRYRLLLAAAESVDAWAVPGIAAAPDSFPYIPVPISDFLNWLCELDGHLAGDRDFHDGSDRYRPVSFLEIGCGIGRNLNIVARQRVLPVARVAGFDSVPEYIEVARRVFGFGPEVCVADCMGFDYGGFDVIYFYRLFDDQAAETAFESHLVSSMTSGSILIGAAGEILGRHRRLAPVGQSGAIFKKR